VIVVEPTVMCFLRGIFVECQECGHAAGAEPIAHDASNEDIARESEAAVARWNAETARAAQRTETGDGYQPYRASRGAPVLSWAVH
jgi:hypothetical protein